MLALTPFVLIALLGSVLSGCTRGTTQIRVQNATDRDLAVVTVMTNKFASLRNGATSDYQVVSSPYEEPSIWTREESGYFRNYKNLTYGGGPRLSSGFYTYVLSVDTNDQLAVKVRRDQ